MKNAKSEKRMSMMLQSLDALMRIAIHSDTIDEFEPEDSTQLYAKKNDVCDSIDQIADAIAEPEDEGEVFFGGNDEDEDEVTFGDAEDEHEVTFGYGEDENEHEDNFSDDEEETDFIANGPEPMESEE
jgi:hypothetical protein